jgi:hypothetical protein
LIALCQLGTLDVAIPRRDPESGVVVVAAILAPAGPKTPRSFNLETNLHPGLLAITEGLKPFGGEIQRDA